MIRTLVPWTVFRAVSNSYAARITILIPLVGYWIIFNAEVVKWFRLVSPLAGGGKKLVSVSPRLMLIYYGLCAIAVATALYSVFCPGKVKHYGDANAYVRGDGPAIKDFAFERIEAEFPRTSYRHEFKRIRERYERGGRTPSDLEKEQINNGILHLHFRKMNESWPPIRWLVAVLYLFGFVCLLIPSIGVFWRVSKILWPIVVEQSHLLF